MNLDTKLPWLLQKSNIAHIEAGAVLIGDRRRYPWERTFVTCSSVEQVAQAIRGMVTQGGGPLQVGLTTMRFVARRIEAGDEANRLSTFIKAAEQLSSARPTNTTMRRTLATIVEHLRPYYAEAIPQTDITGLMDSIVTDIEAGFDIDYQKMSDAGAQCISDGDGILTTCFAEHSFILSLMKAKEEGKDVTVFVPETRPYLQGARLTAPSLEELGIPVQLITDGMGAHYMAESAITHYMTAADVVAMDGTVVNKTGSLANAICAHYYQIPYTVFAMAPDPTIHIASDIIMEERDGKEVLHFNGKMTTLKTIKGRYPAFDCIEASLVTSIVTPRGLALPQEIRALYQQDDKK